ncbi:hypothetical protein [Pseudaeromonas paramecii]|uniref:Uncharacterized protein n=1 Tax=Pseudaeromonas paramecii TaxID=2138166 RepID=A0ABP8QI98_9GAMM
MLKYLLLSCSILLVGQQAAYANCNPASGTKSACKQMEENEAIRASAKRNILEALKKSKAPAA